MDHSDDAMRGKVAELYAEFLAPYQENVDQLQAELERRLALHRASEDARLVPYRQHVARLRRSVEEREAALAALRSFYEQTLGEERARLAPFRARLADVAGYCALVQGAVRARADVVAAAAAFGPLFDPRHAALEAAHDSERQILFELLCLVAPSSRDGLVERMDSELQAEMGRPGAPPLSAMLDEISRAEGALAVDSVALGAARGMLCGQMVSGSAEWDTVSVSLNEAVCSALGELTEAIPGVRRRAEQYAFAFFQEPGGY
jgi:hypothetical protein